MLLANVGSEGVYLIIPAPANAANADGRVWARGRCASQAATRSKFSVVASIKCSQIPHPNAQYYC